MFQREVVSLFQSNQLIELFFPIVSLLINIFLQLSINYFNKKCGILKSEYFGFIGGLLFLIFFEGFFNYFFFTKAIQVEIIMITNIIIYSCLGYCYFHFINLAITARRTRLIRLLYSHKGGLTYPEILQSYNGKKMIDNRINRLIGSGQIVKKGNNYFIGNSTMLFITKIVLLLKIIIIGKKSEFS